MRLQSTLEVTSLMMLLVAMVTFAQQDTVLSYTVHEQKAALTEVGTVATDSRLYNNVTHEEFNRMRFQILTQGNPHASLFVIDEYTSQLNTASVLDRENICPESLDCVLGFNIIVYLRDQDTEILDLYKIIRVSVTLEDINDNSPTFPQPKITIPISEDSRVNEGYFIDGAIDLDTGFNNSVQNYFMEPAEGMFGLDILRNDDGSSDLNIVVKYPLDRETKSFYQLTVYAVDGGDPVRTGSVDVNITITDQNDNDPIFSERLYNVTVDENPPVNSTILTVTATDLDEGENGRVSYQFPRSTQSKVKAFFSVNSTSGEIIAKKLLNYEDDEDFTFEVEAFDHGSPRQTTRVDVIVNLRDMNDNAPQINVNRPPSELISEEASIGDYIAHVAVYDDDKGDNGKVFCNIQGDEFRLEEFRFKDNYKVVLNKPLDYEIQTSHRVVIECHDGGTPSNTNMTSFTLTVEDVNDNYPVFSQQTYAVTIQEETLPPTIVQVNAVDADSGANGNVTYGILPNATTVFTIHPRTGLLTANTKFDRDTTPVIRLPVLAWDGGDPSKTSTAMVVLNISDINDNSPQFESDPVELYIKESQYSQTVQVVVNDPDFGPNGEFVLTFPQNDYLDKYFTFNYLTGEITTNVPIDREEVSMFSFHVTAVDRGIPQQSSSAEVIIHVEDVNDNMPVITYPNNSFNTMFIPISASVGHVITTVVAHDDDEGVNAQLFYFIDHGDSRNLFYMDTNSGMVSVARKMGPEDSDTYKLDIAVRDNGETQRTSYAKLNIVVQLTNDTILPPSPEEEGQRNIMIVVIFVAVTILLSIGIVATIFVIRHIDRQNHSARAPKHEENKFYETAKVDESMSASSNVSKDSDAELLKKRNKKEVSFSIDEENEPGNNSTLTNVTSFTTVKTMPSYMSMDYKPEESQSSSWLYNNTLSTDCNKTDQYCEKERDLSSLNHSHLQHTLQQIQHRPDSHWAPPIREEQTKHLMAMLKKAEDANSEASAETSTSDSGRGGSEEDIHSNRGHTLSDSDEGKQYYQNKQRLNDNAPKKLRPPPPIPVESYPRNISFSDDSVTANTTIANTTVVSCKQPGLNSFDFKTPVQNFDGRSVFTICGQTPRDTFLDTQITTPGFPYSLVDIDDISEMANTRDDVSTTTSGSYTINPDELCNEIDELFFKDVIV